MHFKYNIHFNFMKHSKKFMLFSIIVTLLGVVFLFTEGLNRGVDFKAGTTLDINAGKTIEKAKSEEIITTAGLSHGIITPGGERVSIRFDKVLNEAEVAKVKAGFIDAYGKDVSLEENTVDTSLAQELAQKAIIAVLVASVFICIYVAIRFEWRFAISAIVSLFHDAFFTISIFSIFHLEVNLTFVAAILTIVGYSINDTIVIFDRIRENMRFAKVKNYDDLTHLVDASVSQTLTRSINTVVTVFVGALLLFLLGGESIRHFSLAMMVGLLCGAYSSIFIAAPLWAMMKKSSLQKPRKAAVAKP
ncbi:protein translocase subunit SecF [Gorillibacterium timonense]|uniref:protein translocase subunit SecF n=1 Tax=Gorillibacterium timonense TaxID=1689269 RepID=UPI0009E744E1|nr:protein translocase subunit SecF [Gorillibacterium timonense]